MNHPVPVRTAIVEDHALFRDTIAAVVEASPHLALGHVLSSPSEALQRFADEPPGLALIDLSLDGMTGIELVSEIGRRWPDVRCIVLSGHRKASYAEQTLAAGGHAYILKGRPDDFRAGIAEVLAGRTYVSPPVRPPEDGG